MGRLDTRYIIKLDTKATFLNPTLVFSINDAETSDLYIRVTNKHKLIDVSNMIPVIVVIDPHGQLYSDFMEVTDDNLLYYDIKKTMKSQSGKYIAKVMLVDNQEKKVLKGNFSYAVEDDEISLLDEKAGEDDRLPILTEFISRLSTIEKLELSRQEAETNRVEAEKQRQIAKQQLIDQVNKLIADTSLKVEENLSEQNKKVDDNLLENSNKVTKLISDTTTKIDSYKTEKDEAIQQDLQLYKQETTKNIDDYKLSKDIEINKNLSDYKTSTTTDIETYKNNKNAEINQYKTEKDLEIDTYVANKNKELDRYVAAKNNDIDNYKKAKDLLIDDKLKEVDASEKSRAEAETLRQQQHTEREAFLNGFESRVNANEAKNTEQDGRLNSVEYISKRQDVVLGGLLNESGDKRLAITGEGNHLKLEHSKDGVIEVNSVIGNTLVNLSGTPYLATTSNHGVTSDNDYIRLTANGTYRNIFFENIAYKPSTEYTIIIFIRKNTVNANYSVYDNANTDSVFYGSYYNITPGTTGVFITKQTTRADISSCTYGIRSFIGPNATEGEIEVKFVVLEGDYTNKPIPNEYFEGMKSTFENCLVTQEMIDAGLEKAENLGKYKAELKVVGKNLVDFANFESVSNYDSSIQPIKNGVRVIFNKTGPTQTNSYTYVRSKPYRIDPNMKYVAFSYKYKSSQSQSSRVLIKFMDNDNWDANNSLSTHSAVNGRTVKMPVPVGAKYVQFIVYSCAGEAGIVKGYYIDYYDAQMEEIPLYTSDPSPYGPYKEHVQTLYLDEPLYKDNELCVHNGQLGYWKNRERIVLDGSDDENWRISGANNDDYTTLFFIKDGISKISNSAISDRFRVITSYMAGNPEGIKGDNLDINIRISNSKATDLVSFKQWLQVNPTTVMYELAEPIFIPILENTPQWILECFNTCTLSIDSNITATSMSATYSGNVVSVVALDKIQYEQDKVAIENAYKLSVLGIMTGVTI